MKHTLIGIILFFLAGELSAQVTAGGLPLSFSRKTKSYSEIAVKQLSTINKSELIAIDQKNGHDNSYGVIETLDFDFFTFATKTVIDEQGTIWQYKIVADSALSLGLLFSTYSVPQGASLFIYNEDHSRVLGGYSSANNHPDSVLAIENFDGQHIILEYFEPDTAAFHAKLHLGGVLQSYRPLSTLTGSYIKINCPDGNNWQEDKHAVALITYMQSGKGYVCSGALVNNVRQDGTQYFLTANHCVHDSVTAATVIATFNFEYTDCDHAIIAASQTVSHAKLKATSTVSDFTLLLLTETIPAVAKPYFAGWDASSRNAKSGVGIHHPAGKPKAIATENNPPAQQKQKLSWDEGLVSQPLTHWQIAFDKGGTEGGSSGSPFFDDNHRVIGQLHGGDDYTNYYGKFSVSWSYNPLKTGQLAAWLDPDKTGTKTINSTYTRIKPTADFFTKTPMTCLSSSIQLFDRSMNIPKTWKWKITPASYKFLEKTGDTSQNPIIKFDTTGVYTVQLIVSNNYGADTLVKTHYITVGNQIDVSIHGLPANNTVCGCALDNFSISVLGAANYEFTLEKTSKLSYAISPDSIYVTLRDDQRSQGSFDTWLWVTGNQGTCTDSDSVLLHVEQPKNDDVAAAAILLPGRNVGYFNRCATVEENEPAMLSKGIDSDTTLHSTVWFRFQSPERGVFSIESSGFAQKIALYKAETASDILSGNVELLQEVQMANNEVNPSGVARIYDVASSSGAHYWLQVDGFKNAVGDFYIDYISSDLMVFPNPTSNTVSVLIGTQSTGQATIKVQSVNGDLLYSQIVDVQTTANHFTLDLSSYADGVYIIETELNDDKQQYKCVVLHK